MDSYYYDYLIEQFKTLISIDSTSGDFVRIQKYLNEQIVQMGYRPDQLSKGGIITELGGKEDGIVITAHADTIGLMVRHINSDGTIALINIGRLPENAVENENVRLETRTGRAFTGTIRRKNSCIHVTPLAERSLAADYQTNLVLYLDEPVSSRNDTELLGIDCGDIVSLDTRLTLTDNGYIKSRFLDDKISVALLITFMHYLKKEDYTLRRKVYTYLSMHEEVLHGAACGIPKDCSELMAIDIGCVAPQQNSSEYKVSICAADSRYPYNREIIHKLCCLSEENGIAYAVDIYKPTYTSDADVALQAGYDVKHSLIGPGVLGTHGYERTHKLSIINTFNLLCAYIDS
jgi:aminopeptidase